MRVAKYYICIGGGGLCKSQGKAAGGEKGSAPEHDPVLAGLSPPRSGCVRCS